MTQRACFPRNLLDPVFHYLFLAAGFIAVSFGGLLLPAPAAYTLFRMGFLSGDLPNHDLRHFGRGRWMESPYTRIRFIQEGDISLRQTTGLRAMYQLVFASAKPGPPTPRPSREMDSNRMLGM